MHQDVNRLFRLAMEIASRHDGTINQFLGNGFMALSVRDSP